MNYDLIEYELVLIGWVVALLLGSLLLFLKLPSASAHRSYANCKNTCGLIMVLFGAEILFQWLLRFYFHFRDHVLSVSVYLFAFWVASLLFATGFSSMLAPKRLDKVQWGIVVISVVFYLIVLSINYFVLEGRAQVHGVLFSCVLLFLIACISIYKSVVIYRRAIKDLRTYYSDVEENLMRWMPGVGFGIMLFLLSAPIICLCPHWVGINQLALSILMFIYTFVCIISFSFHYNKVAVALTDNQQGGEEEVDDLMMSDGSVEAESTRIGMNDSLQKVLFDKEQRWHELGGYRVQGITIDQAAREMGTNRSYLSRYLNEVRHMTFYEWVARMRIVEAKSLMSDDRSLSIEQVAKNVGFSSTSSFSTTFKRFEGVSPKKWRNHL